MRWALGNRRGRPAYEYIASLTQDTLEQRIGDTYLTPSCYRVAQVPASEVCVVSTVCIHAGGLLLRRDGDYWFATRPGPVHGQDMILL